MNVPLPLDLLAALDDQRRTLEPDVDLEEWLDVDLAYVAEVGHVLNTYELTRGGASPETVAERSMGLTIDETAMTSSAELMAYRRLSDEGFVVRHYPKGA